MRSVTFSIVAFVVFLFILEFGFDPVLYAAAGATFITAMLAVTFGILSWVFHR